MSEEIFKPIFGKSWESLPKVLQKHYANRPFCDDIGISQGNLDISFKGIFKIFIPLFRLLKMLAPYEGKNVFTRVKFCSEKNSNALCFDREFYFPGKKPLRFFSRLFPQKNNEVIEVMSCGIGWRCSYSYENNKVILRHRGYNFKLCGFFIPLPITFLMGEGYAEEEAISENEFRMKMAITHFLFGIIYEYSGRFRMLET